MTRSPNTVCGAALTGEKCGNRSGLTRIEVLVILFCLFLVILLAVPGIFHFRESQRQVACQERMLGLSVGLLRHAEANDDRLPSLVDEWAPWTVQVLKYLEDPQANRVELTEAPIAEQPRIALPVFLCPNGRQYEPGRNCYIVNGGWGNFETDPETNLVREAQSHTVNIDWNGDETVSKQERLWARVTGVIWRADEVPWSWRLPELDAADGRGSTMLLSETQNSRSWMSDKTFDLAFVVGRNRIELGDPTSPFDVRIESLGPYAVNSSPGGRPGECPAPSSLHPGGVNVLFADGRIRTLSEQIDPLVYLRLMTPGGNQYGESRQFDLDSQEP